MYCKHYYIKKHAPTVHVLVIRVTIVIILLLTLHLPQEVRGRTLEVLQQRAVVVHTLVHLVCVVVLISLLYVHVCEVWVLISLCARSNNAHEYVIVSE